MHDDQSSTRSGPVILHAASAIVFRKSASGGPAELLMVERSESMRFAGGAAVFPGGRLDLADHELAASLETGLEPMDAASRIAAIRETLEETGLVIGVAGPVSAEQAKLARQQLASGDAIAKVVANHGWSLALDRLIPFSRWLPKHHRDRAFDTRFYVTDLGTGAVEIAVDATENRHLFWAGAGDALRLADESKIQIIFPTRRSLERLAQFETFEECSAHVGEYPVRTITPEIVERAGVSWMTIPDDLGYPITEEEMDRSTRS